MKQSYVLTAVTLLSSTAGAAPYGFSDYYFVDPDRHWHVEGAYRWIAQMSLEGFLNGILTHNPGNQLLFADLLLVDGHEALDFFIRTGNVYFKGRAVMVKNSLYLMAMECEIPNYDEARYKNFVDSFKLHSSPTAAKSAD